MNFSGAQVCLMFISYIGFDCDSANQSWTQEICLYCIIIIIKIIPNIYTLLFNSCTWPLLVHCFKELQVLQKHCVHVSPESICLYSTSHIYIKCSVLWEQYSCIVRILSCALLFIVISVHCSHDQIEDCWIDWSPVHPPLLALYNTIQYSFISPIYGNYFEVA